MGWSRTGGGGREGCVPRAREIRKKSRTVPRPRPLTGQVPARATRQRRNDRSSDISLIPNHTSGVRRTGEATGLRRGGRTKLLQHNASEDSATCWPCVGTLASFALLSETAFHKGIIRPHPPRKITQTVRQSCRKITIQDM